MNTIPETIATALAPETAFVLSLRLGDPQEMSQEKAADFERISPAYQSRGIPDSALND